MSLNKQLIPAVVFAALAILCLALLVIFKLQEQKTVLNTKKDFLQTAYDNKKRSINANTSPITFKMYALMICVVPIGLFVFAWIVLNDPLIGIVLGIIGLFIPDLIVSITGNTHQKKFEERYMKAIKALAAGLESGLSIQQSVDEVIANRFIHESIKEGFRQIASDIKIGIPIATAFQTYADNNKSNDARDLASAIAMQTEVGGREAKVVENIANNIRSRMMVRKEIKNIFTDTTLMVNAMEIIPFLAIVFMYFGAREIIQPFFESTFMLIIFFSIIAFMLIGSIIIRRMVVKAKEGGS